MEAILKQPFSTIKKERLLLFTLAAIQFTHIMDFMIMMPLGPQLMRLFHITPQQFGFLVASYTFSAGIFGFFGAFIIDKFDRKTALITAYFGFILGTLACAVSPTYHFLMIARILTGAFGGFLGSLILSIVGDSIPEERRASAMGVVMTSFALASVFGVPFGLYMANQFSWHAPFYFLVLAGGFITILIGLFIPSMTQHVQAKGVKRSPFEVITNIIKDNNQLRGLLLMVLLIMGQFTIIPFLSPYMVSNVGFTEGQLPYIYLLGGLFSIFTLPLIGKMADKYGKSRVFIIFILISFIPLFLITNMPRMAIPFVLIVTTAFFICMGGRIIPATAMVTSTVKPQSRGGFMSINSSIQQFASGFASFISGAIITKSAAGELLNYQYVGYIAIACSLTCIFLARKIKVVDTTIS